MRIRSGRGEGRVHGDVHRSGQNELSNEDVGKDAKVQRCKGAKVQMYETRAGF